MSQSHQTQDGKKWWEIDDPPVKPSVQPSVAPSEPPSEQPKAPARRWEAARKTYGKGDPDVVLSVEGNRFDRLKGKSKGDKGDRGGKGKAERKGDKGKGEARGKGRDGRGKGQSSKSHQQSHQQSHQPQHHHPSGSARPIFGQPSGSLRQPETADFGSKVHIHVHVNGQEMPRCPTPRGSIAQLLPQAPPEAPQAPSVRIRPTVAPKKLEKKKKRKNRRNQNNFESNYSMDQMDQMEMEMEPEIDVRKSKLPGTSGSGPWNPNDTHPSRPKIIPSQAPASAASASAPAPARKVTKVLQSRPKCMPRKRPDERPDVTDVIPPDSKSSRFSAPLPVAG